MSGLLEMSTVVGCKMMCTYCPQNLHVKKYAERSDIFSMTLHNYFMYLSKIPPSVDIVFAGMAEPFLNPYAVRMVEDSVQHHRTSIYTTGSGLDVEKAKRLVALEYNHFCLHLPDQEGKMNMRITGEYLDVLGVLIKKATNMMCIGTLHESIKERFGISVADSTGSLFSRAGNLKSMMISRKEGVIKCTACTEHLNHNILLPNGDVLLCCMDYNQDHVIGNLNDMEYYQLFQSEEYNRIQAGLRDSSIDILCRKCEVSANT